MKCTIVPLASIGISDPDIAKQKRKLSRATRKLRRLRDNDGPAHAGSRGKERSSRGVGDREGEVSREKREKREWNRPPGYVHNPGTPFAITEGELVRLQSKRRGFTVF